MNYITLLILGDFTKGLIFGILFVVLLAIYLIVKGKK